MSIQDTSVTTDRLRSRAVSQGPFNHAQNIYLFFGGGDRGEIVDAISRTLGAGDGKLVSVHGEPGSGKTLMSLVLADRLKHRRNIIRFDHESIDAATLLRHLLIEISPRDADAVVNNVVADSDSAEPCTDLALQRLWLALQSPLPNDKPFLLLVDSDARLDGPGRVLLEQLAALRYDGKPPIQIVLFETVCKNNPMQQPQESTHSGFDFSLRRLTLAEIGDYLHHQMLLFDFNQRHLFTRDMAYFIAERSEGVFSKIDDFARKGILFANVESGNQSMKMHMFMMDGEPEVATLPHRRQKFLSRHRGALIAFMGASVIVSLAVGIAVFG